MHALYQNHWLGLQKKELFQAMGVSGRPKSFFLLHSWGPAEMFGWQDLFSMPMNRSVSGPSFSTNSRLLRSIKNQDRT